MVYSKPETKEILRIFCYYKVQKHIRKYVISF